MQTEFAEINGFACRFRMTGGDKPPIVFIHELGGSLESWNDLVGFLSGDHNCIAYDMRGAGMSEKFKAFDLDDLADDLRGLLQTLDVNGGVVVVAAAAGSSVAVRFATRHPQHVTKLILLSPAFGVPAERREIAREMADRIEHEGLRAIADATLPKAFPEQHWTSPEAKSRAIARWHGADPQGYAAHYRTIIDRGVLKELPELFCDTVVLAGEDDPFNTPKALQELVRPINNITLETVEAGHFMAVQSPEKIAPIVLRLSAVPSGSAR